MITFKLPIPFLVIGLVLLIAGYHFDAIEMKIAGTVMLSWGFITHVRNIKIVRDIYSRRLHGSYNYIL